MHKSTQAASTALASVKKYRSTNPLSRLIFFPDRAGNFGGFPQVLFSRFALPAIH
jgi:hypothetical protein